MTKRFFQILVLIAVFALGGWLSYRFFVPQNNSVEDATVLLEKIETVTKLITVEGHFSEIYNYSESDGWMLPLWDKKVLVRVRATVSAGYDLESLNIEADATTKTIRMSDLSGPEILSIDHTLDYYDISEGYFTSFTPEDYNRVNQRAKDLIRDQALKSSLMPAAQEQADKMLDLISFMVQSAGWKLEIADSGFGE
jgi:hypothetical protein